ncbi:pyruvate dehydrogenase complex, E1 component [Streptomyces griseoflavus Tu4000]|uniref:Pyruvate dehydrogenase complex, E1 component n=1 Tax=Streptomyces griseoflavus Tu4000 TaxID=467200 RepID=D9XW38_9ACTN|nr:pyruvate dehydrogenase complex, E1 component [Streptomyces griseoflavus Tu4000]
MGSAPAAGLREQPVRHGHRARPGARADGPGDARRLLRHARLGRGRHGRRSRRTGRPAGRRGYPGGHRTALPGAAHLPVPRPLHVRPGPLPRQGGDRALEVPGPHRPADGADARRRGAGRRGARPDRTADRRRDRPCRGRGRAGARGAGRGPAPPCHQRAGRGGEPAVSTAGTQETTTYREALREALREAMRSDDRVFLMGEDVGRYGGCFGVSLGLLEEFGPDRVRDTPLSESAFVGAGIGAALAGMRPIVEIMTVNFSLLALDQILNNAATLLHMSGGQLPVPLVIRMTTGAGRQLAAQHSHSLESFYAHIPGIRVLAPATLEDARHMLAPALADPDPVVIFEHGSLYNASGPLAPQAASVDLDHAAVRRPGDAVTLITYGGSLPKVLAAADELAADGVDAEVVDLRTLRPLDAGTVAASVARTHRAVVVDEAWRTGSVAAEVSARLAEESFYELDAPVERVCGAEVPIPYARRLEEAALPQTAGIVAAAHRAVG